MLVASSTEVSHRMLAAVNNHVATRAVSAEVDQLFDHARSVHAELGCQHDQQEFGCALT